MVACCIWCLACIASNLVKLHLLTLHIIPLIMTCLPVFDTYYICLLTMFVHQTNALLYPHQSLMMRQSPQWVTVRRGTRLKSAVSSSPHDSQETARLNEDSQHSSLFDHRNSPTPPSQVLALTWQCDMWLHLAYGVYLVLLLIRVNCICLVNTLYL